jgi:predicted HTH transcriptional regulator
MVDLKDEDILIRLRNTEDNFVERKSSGDSKDWLPATVAFANSVPVGYPAILFIGVKDDGTPEGNCNLESLQKKFDKKLADAYPPIFYLPKVLRTDGKEFLAVIIPGSPDRPHFAGQAYVRVGSQTKSASEAQFAILIAQRQSKACEILKWLGKPVAIETLSYLRGSAHKSRMQGVLTDCNQFYVSYGAALPDGSAGQPTHSLPLSKVEVSFDHAMGTLKLEIREL